MSEPIPLDVEDIPEDYEVTAYRDPRAAVAETGGSYELFATCGSCGLTWDDVTPTSMTPTPSGRCPFEAFHEYDDEPEETDPWHFTPPTPDASNLNGYRGTLTVDNVDVVVYLGNDDIMRVHVEGPGPVLVHRDDSSSSIPGVVYSEVPTNDDAPDELTERVERLEAWVAHLAPDSAELGSLPPVQTVPEVNEELGELARRFELLPDPDAPGGDLWTSHACAMDLLRDMADHLGIA